MEIDLHGRGSLLITSQLPLATWHEVVLHFATAGSLADLFHYLLEVLR
jgi:hypothetical protein